MKSISGRIAQWRRAVGVNHPIVQAPMAGVTTPKLVAAASECGVLGSHAVAFLEPEKIMQDLREIRQLTKKPFGVNLFAMPKVAINETDGSLREFLRSRESLKPFFEQFNLDTEPDVDQVKTNLNYKDQLITVLDNHEGVKVISFTFGLLERDEIERIQSKGILAVGTATSTQEAITLESLGVDAIVAQGFEAGGHRGSFLHHQGDSLESIPEVGTMALVPQVVDNVSVPVIASGGIMDGRGVCASLILGASAVQMGTAFLTCDESEAKMIHKDAITHAKDTDTLVTNVFSGKPARGIRNDFVQYASVTEHFPIARYPVQQSLTNLIKAKAISQGDTSTPSLWSGQAPMLAKQQSVSQLVNALVSEINQLEAHLTA